MLEKKNTNAGKTGTKAHSQSGKFLFAYRQSLDKKYGTGTPGNQHSGNGGKHHHHKYPSSKNRTRPKTSLSHGNGGRERDRHLKTRNLKTTYHSHKSSHNQHNHSRQTSSSSSSSSLSSYRPVSAGSRSSSSSSLSRTTNRTTKSTALSTHSDIPKLNFNHLSMSASTGSGFGALTSIPAERDTHKDRERPVQPYALSHRNQSQSAPSQQVYIKKKQNNFFSSTGNPRRNSKQIQNSKHVSIPANYVEGEQNGIGEPEIMKINDEEEACEGGYDLDTIDYYNDEDDANLDHIDQPTMDEMSRQVSSQNLDCSEAEHLDTLVNVPVEQTEMNLGSGEEYVSQQQGTKHGYLQSQSQVERNDDDKIPPEATHEYAQHPSLSRDQAGKPLEQPEGLDTHRKKAGNHVKKLFKFSASGFFFSFFFLFLSYVYIT